MLPSERYSGPSYDIEKEYARIHALYEANPFKDEAYSNEHSNALIIDILKGYKPSLQFIQAMGNMLYGLYVYEGLYDLLPPLKTESDLKRKDVEYQTHADRLALADQTARDFFKGFFQQVKPFAEPGERTVPLIELCDRPGEIVQSFNVFTGDAFPRTTQDIYSNLIEASGLHPEHLSDRPKFKYAKDADLSPLEMVDAYLKGTPFENILRLPLPFAVPDRIRFEHTHVVAGSGAGKTTLLTQQFLEDVFRPDQPSLIVIDGKGTWAPALQRFACFAPDRKLSERLIIINPQGPPPALNMFKTDPAIIDGVSENLAYIFGSREFELSAKQRTAFTYAAQLIFSMENPTIETLIALMQDPAEKTGGVPAGSPFREAINRQSYINRRFFNELFYHPTEFLETKRQIQNRIYDLLSCPAFAGMFTQEDNRLDMNDIMQGGKILIVDASPGAVGEKAASTFGRYIISLALSTARARINIPRSDWRSCFLFVDEAQNFCDEERTQPLLQQAREFNLGVILAHQKLADLTPTLRATFAGNTSSKYCANPSADDARDMAKEMRTDASFILSQEHRDGHAHFAAFVRGLTPRALSYRFPLGTMESTPKMSDAEYSKLMDRNNQRMMGAPPTTPAARPPKKPPDDDSPPDAAKPRY